MNADKESRAVEESVERLTVDFPGVPAETVSSIVEEAHEKFDGLPIRTYVPIFVERAARERLRADPADRRGCTLHP